VSPENDKLFYVTENAVEDLLSELMTATVRFGFDRKYELSPFGEQIEVLIDHIRSQYPLR
jgi:hypothetical protein